MELRKQQWDESKEDENEGQRHKMSVAAFEGFLDLPQVGEHQHYELIGGTFYNMASPSPEHQLISLALASLLRQQLPAGGPCRILQEIYTCIEDQPSTRPDILLTCDKADYSPAQRAKKHHRVHSPRLIVEILSDSTEKFDRGEKFERYCKSPTLEVYLLVHQTQHLVEIYQRSLDWQRRDYCGGEHLTFTIGDLQFNIDVDALYVDL